MGVSSSVIEDMKLQSLQMYSDHMEKLKELIKEEELRRQQGEVVDMHYLAPAMYDLYDMLTRYEQFAIDVLKPGELYKKSRQVIRCKRYIPEDVLHIYHPERSVVDGLYLAVEVYFLDSKAVWSACAGNHRSALANPEEHGLPSSDKVLYGTRRVLNNDTFVAIAKGQWVEDYVVNSFHFEYPTLNLNALEVIG